ncbi:hypothetical protein [Paracoccus sp. SCSIO 75233]|uniref:hypothetical protein n=1 Tax=Paracoccus sp. SCSIO 75233 TaxID=3017782 RepID=UPI0022F07B7D|nr:hypothetical protein [Paracoccus sp. SCSIO 75233]WBU53058.1 hypothetical protein PAF12_14775 [Paracoccus sp. SCSIO 75233]
MGHTGVIGGAFRAALKKERLMKTTLILVSSMTLALVAVPAIAAQTSPAVYKAANTGGPAYSRAVSDGSEAANNVIRASDFVIDADRLDELNDRCDELGHDDLDDCLAEEDFEINDAACDDEADDAIEGCYEEFADDCAEAGFDNLQDCVNSLEGDET